MPKLVVPMGANDSLFVAAHSANLGLATLNVSYMFIFQHLSPVL